MDKTSIDRVQMIAEFTNPASPPADGPADRTTCDVIRHAFRFDDQAVVPPLAMQVQLSPVAVQNGAVQFLDRLRAVLAKLDTEPAAAAALRRASEELAKVG